jgi:hypothetical protein
MVNVLNIGFANLRKKLLRSLPARGSAKVYMHNMLWSM